MWWWQYRKRWKQLRAYVYNRLRDLRNRMRVWGMDSSIGRYAQARHYELKRLCMNLGEIIIEPGDILAVKEKGKEAVWFEVERRNVMWQPSQIFLVNTEHPDDIRPESYLKSSQVTEWRFVTEDTFDDVLGTRPEVQRCAQTLRAWHDVVSPEYRRRVREAYLLLEQLDTYNMALANSLKKNYDFLRALGIPDEYLQYLREALVNIQRQREMTSEDQEVRALSKSLSEGDQT